MSKASDLWDENPFESTGNTNLNEWEEKVWLEHELAADDWLDCFDDIDAKDWADQPSDPET